MLTMATVDRELSREDKALLREDGVVLPRQRKQRKKRRRATPPKVNGEEKREPQDWAEVKGYLDPNPHLRDGAGMKASAQVWTL